MKLYGLLLSGGKSIRMGRDKGKLSYHHLPQREYAYDMLRTLCDRAFMSIRPEQEMELQGFDCILDKNEYNGPLNGILSAHKTYPLVAWLVLACDLPLLNKSALLQLISERDPDKMATAFASKESGLPEPLAAIWEPLSLANAIAYMDQTKHLGPRKFLMNSDVKLIMPKDDELLFNANSEAEYRYAKSKVIQ